jgi:hypothetical protein
MARQPDSLGSRFALVLALTIVVVTLMTWVAPQSLSKWVAPNEPSDAVYRAQHLNLF